MSHLTARAKPEARPDPRVANLRAEQRDESSVRACSTHALATSFWRLAHWQHAGFPCCSCWWSPHDCWRTRSRSGNKATPLRGAAGPASAPPLSLKRPARRTPGHSLADHVNQDGSNGRLAAGQRTTISPRLLAIQLAAARLIGNSSSYSIISALPTTRLPPDSAQARKAGAGRPYLWDDWQAGIIFRVVIGANP